MATQTFLEFSPRTLGKISHFDEHIFQMGWFNHQLVMLNDTPHLGIGGSGFTFLSRTSAKREADETRTLGRSNFSVRKCDAPNIKCITMLS